MHVYKGGQHVIGSLKVIGTKGLLLTQDANGKARARKRLSFYEVFGEPQGAAKHANLTLREDTCEKWRLH